MSRAPLSLQSEEFVRAQIKLLGDIQERNKPTSAAWKAASRALRPLFAEMARRQKAGLLLNS